MYRKLFYMTMNLLIVLNYMSRIYRLEWKMWDIVWFVAIYIWNPLLVSVLSYLSRQKRQVWSPWVRPNMTEEGFTSDEPNDLWRWNHRCVLRDWISRAPELEADRRRAQRPVTMHGHSRPASGASPPDWVVLGGHHVKTLEWGDWRITSKGNNRCLR